MADHKSLPSTVSPPVVDCDGCGVCCLHMGYPPYLDGSDDGPVEPAWQRLPDQLKRQLHQVAQQFKTGGAMRDTLGLDGPCIWFDQESKRCTQHEHRPQVCRDFRVGGKGCRQWRDYYQIDPPQGVPT